jgi:transposase
MARTRKKYSREFKIAAVQQLLAGGGLAHTARQLQLNRSMLGRWRAEYLVDPEQAFLGSGRRPPAEVEVAQLRREIVELREEREILKKALAYYGRGKG